jgi:hypothetical protein
VAKLADFGVAHLAGDDPLTRTGDVVGTLAYMAPEQAAGKRIDERADLYSLALVLYEALAGHNPVRAGSPAATARRVGTVLPPLRRSRKDLPEELCAAIDAALRPKPDERGTLSELADELAESLPEVSDEGGGFVAPHRIERAYALPRGTDRLLAAALAGGLAAAALAWLGQPVLPALGAAAAVAVLPRIGWLLAAVATLGVIAAERPGAALLVAAALAPVPLLLYRRGTAWSLPALAPLLGLAGLAGAFPALAGQAKGAVTRAALGALGAWWALLAAPLLGRETLGGVPLDAGASPADAARGAADTVTAVRAGDSAAAAAAANDAAHAALAAGADAQRAAADVLGPLITSGALLYAALWACAALVLPWLVRGRWLAIDVVAACVWAAALGASTAATAEFIGAPEPRGVVLGAVIGGVLAVGVPHLRGGRVVEP